MYQRLVLVLVLISPMSAALAADIGLSPPRMELSIPAGGTATEVVSLVSSSAGGQALSVTAGDWTQDESGQISFLPPGQGSYSASPWLTLSADAVSIPPGGQASYRFTITVPRDSSLDGTYRSVVFFETQPSAPSDSGGSSIRMRQRLGLILYVTVTGTEKNGSTLNDMFVDGKKLHAVVENVGNTVMRYTGTVEVREASGTTIKSIALSSGPILRESQRDISTDLPVLPSGYYVLLLLVKDSRGGLLTGQLPYEVK